MSAEIEKPDMIEVFAALDEISQALAKHGLQATEYRIDVEFVEHREDKYVATMAPDSRHGMKGWFSQCVMTAREDDSPREGQVRQVRVTQ